MYDAFGCLSSLFLVLFTVMPNKLISQFIPSQGKIERNQNLCKRVEQMDNPMPFLPFEKIKGQNKRPKDENLMESDGNLSTSAV